MAISSIKFNLNPRVIKALNLYKHCSKINEGLRELEARRSITNLGKYSKREGVERGRKDEERERERRGGRELQRKGERDKPHLGYKSENRGCERQSREDD